MFKFMNGQKKQELHKQGIKMGSSDMVCRQVITLQQSDRHVGSIYQVCNFAYYGLTDPKNVFYDEFGNKLNNPRVMCDSDIQVMDNSYDCSVQRASLIAMA